MTPVTLLTLTISTGTGTVTYRYADVQTDAYPAHAPRLAGPAELEDAAASPLTRSLPVRRARVRLSNVAVPAYATTAPTMSQILGAGQDVVGAQASVQVVDADTQTVLTTIGGYVEEIPALSLTEATLVVSDALAGEASTLLPCALTDLFPSVQAPEGTALAVICGTARRVRLYPVSRDDEMKMEVRAAARTSARRITRYFNWEYPTVILAAGDQLVYEISRERPDQDLYFGLRLQNATTGSLIDTHTWTDQNGLANNAYAGSPHGCMGWYRRVLTVPAAHVGWRVHSWRVEFRGPPSAEAYQGTGTFARAAIVGAAGNVRADMIGKDFSDRIPGHTDRMRNPADSIAIIDADFGYRFGAWRTGTGVSVANAYLNGRRMAPSEYAVVSPLPGVSALKLTAPRPTSTGDVTATIIADDGDVVHADFTSTEFADNPARVARFFLSDAHHGLGRRVDAASFTAAAAALHTTRFAQTTGRQIAVGGAVTRLTPAATLLQEFLLHGAVLTHAADGTIGMQVDGPGTQAALELGHNDETGWHNFTPANAAPVRAAAQPKSLLVRGVPDPGFAGETERWLATTKRSRTFPRGAEQEIHYRYIVDPDSLDRQAHYLWEQMQAQATPLTGDLKVTEPDAYALDVGDRLVVTVPGLGLARVDYRIGGFRNRGARFGLTLYPYRAAAFTYAAGTDREIEPQARQLVDYSRTKPQAPTNLVVSADALRDLPDGTHEVSVTASVTAPRPPVDQIYFKLVRTGGAAPEAEATVSCHEREAGVSATLRAESGKAYTLHAYAEMSTNDAGFRRGDAVTGTATAIVDPDAELKNGRPGFTDVVDLPLYTGGVGTLDLVGEWHAAGVASTATTWPASLSLTLVTATEETRDQLLALRTGHNVALFDDPDHWVSGALTATPTSVTFTASSQTRYRVTLAFTRDSHAGDPNFSSGNRGAQLNYSEPAAHPATQAEVWTKTPYSEQATPPATPTGDATFTRQSGAVTDLSGGWTDDVPTTEGHFLWRARAPIPEGWGNTHTIAPGDWQIPRRISHDGLSYFEAAIYKVQGVSVAAPARPTGGSFDFATRTLTPPAGWSPPPGPALGADQRLYVCAATAHDGAGDLWRPIVGDANLVSQSRADAAGSWVSADLSGDPAVTTAAAASSTIGDPPSSGRMFVAKGKAAEDRRTERNQQIAGNRLDIRADLRGSGDPSGSALRIGARFDYADDRTATTKWLTTDANVVITATTDNRWTEVSGSIDIPAGADRITPRIEFTGSGVANSATINFGDVVYTVVDVAAWTTPRRAEQAAAVNMVYKRSPTQPAALPAGPDRTPTGTADAATSAPGSGRLWENFGIRPPEAANWTWGGWRKAEGEDGQDGVSPPATPGPPGSTARYAYVALTTQDEPSGNNAPQNSWSTGRTSGEYRPKPHLATVTYTPTAPQATRSRQYVGRFSRTETGSTKTDWVWEGIVASWVPAPNLHRYWVRTGARSWDASNDAFSYMKSQFPNGQPAIGDTFTQRQAAPNRNDAAARGAWFETRVWNGSTFVSDYEISGANLIVNSIGSRTTIAFGGSIQTNDYQEDDGTGLVGQGVYISSGHTQFPLTRVTGTLYAKNIEANVINAYFFSSTPVTIADTAEYTVAKSTGGKTLREAKRAVGVLIYYENETGMALTACRFGTSATFQKSNNVKAHIVLPNRSSPNHTLQVWRHSDSVLKFKRTTTYRSSTFTIRYVYWLAIAS